MLVVSGCPRSGTSLMMDCLRLALGDDRLLGMKFPQLAGVETQRQVRDGETAVEHAARLYVLEKTNGKNAAEAVDMNPNGFWECPYTVRGVQWHLGMPDTSGRVCKIVSQGLFRSDPRFIDRVIFMLRDPHEVAKSQERLRRPLPFGDPAAEGLLVHSPLSFIRVTAMAAQWLHETGMPYLLVEYGKLVGDPDAQLARVRTFIGEGDFSRPPVDRGLQRSKPEPIESHLWPFAEEVYCRFRAGDLGGVVDFVRRHGREINREDTWTFCTRLGRPMAYNNCLHCRDRGAASPVARFRQQAEANGIDWRSEPCIFECLTRVGEHVDMQTSIRNNHWECGS